jgi:environmental stress-induced protein Ves
MSPDMQPHRIHVLQCPTQPWKNGGGTTRELLTWPSKENWQLRISVADITQDGAFSAFAGITRSFAVIEGAGVNLKLRDGWRSVTKNSDPLQFAGNEAPDCKLIDGATRDLNVMWRTGCKAKIFRAYKGDVSAGIGFFALQEMTLYWQGNPVISTAKTGEHIGWWIDFDGTKVP